MRQCLAVLVILFLAACASAGPNRTGSISFQSKVAEAPDMSEDEVKDYVTDLTVDQLENVCRERQTIRSQVECTREAVFRGFDTTGEARKNCKSDAPISELIRCVVLGSLIYDLVTKADPEDADFDWNGSNSMFQEMARSMGSKMADKCLEGGLAMVDKCYIESVGKMFALTDLQVASCADDNSSRAAADCMLRVFFVQRFEQAIKRMGVGVGQGA
jgi:hypothetical protein